MVVVRWAQISTSDERQSVACRGPHVQKSKLLAAADGADRAALARGFADVMEMHRYTDGALLSLNRSTEVEWFLYMRRLEVIIGLSTPKDGFVNFAGLLEREIRLSRPFVLLSRTHINKPDGPVFWRLSPLFASLPKGPRFSLRAFSARVLFEDWQVVARYITTHRPTPPFERPPRAPSRDNRPSPIVSANNSIQYN